VDDVAGTVQVIEANIVEQTVDYPKNSSKYEEINQYIGYREDKNYGNCPSNPSTDFMPGSEYPYAILFSKSMYQR